MRGARCLKGMNKREEIKRIWSECFDDSPEYVDMYFDRVYNDADGMTLERGGRVVSSLLLQKYRLMVQRSEVGMSYIAGAGTRRNARGNGYMSALIVEALGRSATRGDAVCALIPANDRLYSYYKRFGFTTVFYADEQRYTSVHAFSTIGKAAAYRAVDNYYGDDLYDAFRRFECERGGMVVHTRRDFLNILDDLRMDSDSQFVAMADDCGRVVSMAWAVQDVDNVVMVKELFGEDDDARQAALRELRRHFPRRSFRVLAPAGRRSGRLRCRGMARIVNVGKLLEAVAVGNPGWRSAIRVVDRVMHENNHTYMVEMGSVRVDDCYRGMLDFDVSVEVLCAMTFSDQAMGDILGYPSARPHMSLMLD